eukprot:1983566-Pyramimonas_sp.AAC.1
MEQRRFERKGMLDQLALNATVVAGGQWPRARCREEGFQVTLDCPRCKAAPRNIEAQRLGMFQEH